MKRFMGSLAKVWHEGFLLIHFFPISIFLFDVLLKQGRFEKHYVIVLGGLAIN